MRHSHFLLAVDSRVQRTKLYMMQRSLVLDALHVVIVKSTRGVTHALLSY